MSEIPSGQTVFIDANIFLEHFLTGNADCAGLLSRVAAGDLHAVTSTVVMAEVRHRLLIAQAVREGHARNAGGALRLFKDRPGILSRPSEADRHVSAVIELKHLRMVGMTPARFKAAQKLGPRHQLLTNDALHIAVMRAGQLDEFGPAALILTEPTADYTMELLAAVPQVPRDPVL